MLFDENNVIISTLNLFGIILGGFLVGVGTRMGSGCTSGHAVCGIPRWKLRNVVATAVFMVVAIGFATLRYYADFLYNGS